MHPNYLNARYVFKKRIKEFAIYILTFFRIRSETRRLKSIWDRVEKKRDKLAVIIAGGPSFDKCLLDHLLLNRSNYEIYVINFYCKNELSNSLLPDYYVLSDPAHLAPLNEDTRISNLTLKRYIKKHKIRLCCPISGDWSDYGSSYLCFDDKEVLFSSNVHPKYPRGYPSNTTFKAIALAQALEYKKIFLLGLNYDYPRNIFLDKSNKLMLRSNHHYGSTITDYSIYYESVSHALNWWSYDFLYFSKLKSANTVNVTADSMIDCFERILPKDFIRGDCLYD